MDIYEPWQQANDESNMVEIQDNTEEVHILDNPFQFK